MANRTRLLRIFFTLLPALCAAIPALSGEIPAQRPKIGLALSGGGARGAAHVGVLRILEREGVPIDFIAGVSMGALTGGLYATGYSPSAIEEFLVNQDWNSIFSDAPQWHFTPLADRADSRYQVKIALRGWNFEIPGGLLGGQRFTEALDVLTAEPMLRAQNDFDRLNVPFRAVATNLIDGKPYIFHQGSMTQAIRASVAVPMMFAPLETEDALLVDGGLVNNLPTDVVRDMGADIVIAVDVSTPLFGREDLRTLFSVIDQSISLQIVKNVEESKKLASIVLTPDLNGYSNTNYDKILEIIKQGEEAAERHIDEIRALAAGIAPRGARPSAAAPAAIPIIESISFSGLQNVPEKQIRSKLRLKPGDEAEPSALAAEVSSIYATRLFESVSYTLEPAGESYHYRLIFRVREDLLNAIGAGIRYDNDYGFTILTEFIARQLFNTPSRAVATSQFGGLEHHAASLRFVPFYTGYFYIEPKAEISRQKRLNWRDTTMTYRFTDKREGGEIILGGALSRQAELSAGYRIGRVRIFDMPDVRASQSSSILAGLSARLNWDSLDFPEYPRSGRQFIARLEKRDGVFGSDFNNIKGMIEYRRYMPLSDRGTLRFELMAGYSEGDIPFYDQFFVGGYSQSSRASEPFIGFGADEIAARQMGIAGLSYYHRIITRPLSILKQGYLTATYNGGVFSERGSAPYDFQNLNGLGAGLALDTRVGPLRMTVGWGEGGRANFYMSFGPSF
ncbi:MAG: patatin-like phospholipase family protein [Acidobacteriota bacterium]|jgi:NTE family protein|nr:patatin-like phospholipase family protein [Acidobacteriota bacterium]